MGRYTKKRAVIACILMPITFGAIYSFSGIIRFAIVVPATGTFGCVTKEAELVVTNAVYYIYSALALLIPIAILLVLNSAIIIRLKRRARLGTPGTGQSMKRASSYVIQDKQSAANAHPVKDGNISSQSPAPTGDTNIHQIIRNEDDLFKAQNYYTKSVRRRSTQHRKPANILKFTKKTKIK